MPSASLLLRPLEDAEVSDDAPALLPESVEEVEVYVVGLQLLELLVEVLVEVLRLVNEPAGHLGGELHFLPVAIPQGFTDDYLALPLVVGVG